MSVWPFLGALLLLISVLILAVIFHFLATIGHQAKHVSDKYLYCLWCDCDFLSSNLVFCLAFHCLGHLILHLVLPVFFQVSDSSHPTIETRGQLLHKCAAFSHLFWCTNSDLRKESCQVSAGFLSFTYFLIYEFLFFRHRDFLALVRTWWWWWWWGDYPTPANSTVVLSP